MRPLAISKRRQLDAIRRFYSMSIRLLYERYTIRSLLRASYRRSILRIAQYGHPENLIGVGSRPSGRLVERKNALHENALHVGLSGWLAPPQRSWCCRTGLNCRPLPYQGSALPLSYGSIRGRGKRGQVPCVGTRDACHKGRAGASMAWSIFRRQLAPDLIRGGCRFAVRKCDQTITTAARSDSFRPDRAARPEMLRPDGNRDGLGGRGFKGASARRAGSAVAGGAAGESAPPQGAGASARRSGRAAGGPCTLSRQTHRT